MLELGSEIPGLGFGAFRSFGAGFRGCGSGVRAFGAGVQGSGAGVRGFEVGVRGLEARVRSFQVWVSKSVVKQEEIVKHALCWGGVPWGL